jgi:hypothetical protein|tara:strand:+ start:51 stop:314 length:264 start_codon:yes stop_codon:yes gene_type:complete
MKEFPIVEVHWGDAWIDTDDYSFEEAKKLTPVTRKTIGYLVATTDDCIILATDLYNQSKFPAIKENTINTPMVIPWGMVLEFTELEF